MNIVVTGAAGFIGSNLVKGLNARGIDDIIAVDDLTQGDKFRNLADLAIEDYVDASDFYTAFSRVAFGTVEAVFAKFLAGWALLTAAILLSFPMAITVGYLGQPDWGVIATTYLGAILMAGAYLAVCSLMSALTKNQVIAFVLSFMVCLTLLFLGFSSFTEFLEGTFPLAVADAVANFSFITHFDAFTKGIIDPKDVIFFVSLTGFALFLNVVALER